MPLWVIYHPPGTFEDDASKQALSKDITHIYSTVGTLPPFYVVVNFIKLSPENTWIGGEKQKNPFIRLTIDHIAVRMPDEDATYKNFTDLVDKQLKPHIGDKGYDWEYHIDETERRLWKINGFAPPPWKSEEEARWAKENRPSPWQ